MKPRFRRLHRLIGPTKLIACAISPILLVLALISIFASMLYNDYLATGLSVIGMILAANYLFQVTNQPLSFETVFGKNWEERIPTGIEPFLLSRRWAIIAKSAPKASWHRNVVVGTPDESGDRLLADIWEPANNEYQSGLSIIYLHGSAWHFLDKDFGTRFFFKHLCAQGHLIVDLAYTLAPKAKLLDMVADVKRAIAWLKVNGNRYHIDSNRIVLMGGSAGGHLALLAAYTPNHTQFQPNDIKTDTSVRAVVSYYGLPDLKSTFKHIQRHYPQIIRGVQIDSNDPPFIRELLERTRVIPPYGDWIDIEAALPKIMGGTPDEVPGLYEIGSPINQVGPHCPPTLLLQGSDDFAGMTQDVRQLHSALLHVGVKSMYVEFPHTEHAFDLILPRISPVAQAATYVTERFLALMT